MAYDYSRLHGRVVEKIGTQAKFAKEMNLSERSISLKMSGKREWKQSEIIRACDILEIGGNQISDYFFTYKVH